MAASSPIQIRVADAETAPRYLERDQGNLQQPQSTSGVTRLVCKLRSESGATQDDTPNTTCRPSSKNPSCAVGSSIRTVRERAFAKDQRALSSVQARFHIADTSLILEPISSVTETLLYDAIREAKEAVVAEQHVAAR